MNSFGETLKKYRVAKMITLRELGEYVNKAISYLSDVEQNRKRPPELEVVKKIEEKLGVTNNELVLLAKNAREISHNIKIHEKLRAMPNLANILMRSQDFTNEEFEKIIMFCEEIKQGKENNDDAKGISC